MDLAGSLATIGLAEVFQNIAFNHHSGTLTLKEGERKARIAFDEGNVRAVAVQGRELDYLDIARKCELASPEVLDQASSANLRRTLKAYLIASGDLDEETYDATIAAYVEEELLPLFGWNYAKFSFEKGELKKRIFDKEQLDCAIALDPTGVAMEAARRIDEWEDMENVPTDEDVLVHAGIADVELPEGTERLLPLVDGTRTVAQLVKEAPLKEFDVRKLTATLTGMGVLVPATAVRVRELAIQARVAGNVNLATHRLEVALGLDPEDLETRAELVRLFERAGRRQDAAREQVKLAEAQAERGDISGALESFEEATVLAPDDLDILERILRLHERCGDGPSALKIGHRLAEALVAKGCFEDARPLYERLLKRGPSLSLHESFATCLLKLNENKQAAKHLLVVADAAFDHREFGTALRHYRRVLEIEKKNKSAAERIEKIESGKAQDRARRRRRMRWYALAVTILACCAAQAYREWRAQSAWHGAQHATALSLVKSNGDQERADAIHRLAAVGGEHPLTRSGALAEETATTLLEVEIARIEGWLVESEKAGTVVAAEAFLVRIEKQIERLDELPRPEGPMKALWEASRDRMQSRIAVLVEKRF